MKIDAIVLCKNEENHIDKCLHDLDQYVDKIIVIDNGSTDNSLEIIKSYDKVEYIVYPTEFHDACLRNIALLMARKVNDPDWILRVDADEIFEDRMKEKVHELMDQSFCNQWTFRWIHMYDDIHVRVDGELGKRITKCAMFRVLKAPMNLLPHPTYFTWNEHHSGVRYYSWGMQKEKDLMKEFLSDVLLIHYGYLKGSNRCIEKIKVIDNEPVLCRLSDVERFAFMRVSDYYKQLGVDDLEKYRR